MYLGIDIGTGSTKAVLTDRDGRILAQASRTHRADMPAPGHVEFDAEGVWWEEVASLSRELLRGGAAAGQRAGTAGVDPSALRGVAVSGLGPCLVLTDETFTPLRPAILYGVDTRSEQQVRELEETFGAEDILTSSGSELSSQALGPKIRWVRDNEPEVFARATHWFSASNFILAKLTGEYVLDQHSASQTDPLHKLETGTWISERSEAVAEHLPMPRLAWSTEIAGEVTPGAAEITGIPAGTPVTAGTIDAWAEAFSAGVRSPGDLMLMYGSTFFFVEQLSGAARHPGLWATRGTEPGSFSLSAGMATSGSIVNWFQEFVGGLSFEQLSSEAAGVAPGAEGVMVLPYFAGERTPIFDPKARGTITGLTLSHRRGHVLRAIYEGMACGVAQILDLLDGAAGTTVQRLVCVGGGTKSPLWAQIVSDVTGREQQVPEQTIGASYGDALMAAIAVGDVTPETDWTRIERTISPDPANADVYARLLETYTQAYPAMRETMHRLA